MIDLTEFSLEDFFGADKKRWLPSRTRIEAIWTMNRATSVDRPTVLANPLPTHYQRLARCRWCSRCSHFCVDFLLDHWCVFVENWYVEFILFYRRLVNVLIYRHWYSSFFRFTSLSIMHAVSCSNMQCYLYALWCFTIFECVVSSSSSINFAMLWHSLCRSDVHFPIIRLFAVTSYFLHHGFGSMFCSISEMERVGHES